MNQSVTEVFVEQTLALPGSAKYAITPSYNNRDSLLFTLSILKKHIFNAHYYGVTLRKENTRINRHNKKKIF